MIDTEIKCQWCGGIQRQTGPQYLGFGFNTLSYQCKKCKAAAIFARHTSKEIEGLEINPKYKQ